MKQSMQIIILLVIFLTGCAEEQNTADLIATGDSKAISARKKELSAQQKEITKEMAAIDAFLNAGKKTDNLPLVTTFNVKSERFDHYFELQGDVSTRQNVLIYPEVGGILTKVHIKEGDYVKQGQLLASIHSGGLNSQLVQFKTQLELAQTTFDRQQKLWDQKIGSEIQYLQAKSNFEAQQSVVNQLESQLSKFNIKAPFSGVIDDLFKEQGTVVGPSGQGSEIFRIINLSNMYLEVDLPESYITTVKKGSKVEVIFPLLGTSMISKVRKTGNFINPNNRSFKAEVSVNNDNQMIKPNMTGKVKINDYSKDNALLIPQSLISENSEGQQYVFVAKEKKGETMTEKRVITTGMTQGDNIEILTGLKSGENLILEGARSVKDGQKVKVLTK